MTDMLVNLLELKEIPVVPGITVRRALPHEKGPVCQFILNNFGQGWSDEASVAFSNKPTSIFIAISNGQVCGFCAYECTAKAFLGPEGVTASLRGLGIGKALLLSALHGLREMGYVYGIIGGVGPADFYGKIGATIIPNSTPGIYANPLRT